MNKAFFFQTQQIHDNTNLFDQFKKQNIFFSYFQVDQNYYLFLYAQKSIQIDFLYQSIDVIQELDSKQRKIRSLRGFFLYALEIMETGKEYEILNTNLQPFFWRKVKTIIRQNQKDTLLEFLFGSQDSLAASETQNHLNEKIEILQNQVNSLQDRIRDLEISIENSKDALSPNLKVPDETKITQQGDSTLKSEKGAYSGENGSKVNSEVREDSNLLLEGSIIDEKATFESQQYNIPLEQNFITLGRISDQQKIEIIKLGFQLHAQGKISLKKYYESTDPNSLFQHKGYQIKYDTIRKNHLYQQLKE